MGYCFNSSILREYDIRGIYEETLTNEDAYWIGKTFGQCVQDNSGSKVIVSRDGRLSSPALLDSLIKGLIETGLEINDIGLGPTPMLYFAEYHLNADAAIMITGSHNPPNHNGFKMSLKRKPFYGAQIQELQSLTGNKNIGRKGTYKVVPIIDEYVKRLVKDFPQSFQLNVAWDCGNGATGNVIKKLINLLPGTHILMNEIIDGTFPSHHPDPTDPKNLIQLQETVLNNKCDFGVAFDGDGDRLGVVDGRGRILWGDQILALFAKEVLKKHPNTTIIADVKASQTLFQQIELMGGQSLMWKTGHSNIKAKMAETNALLAGEMSGHIFFADDYYGFDDGIYAAVRLIKAVLHMNQSLSEFYDQLPQTHNTPEIRIFCENSKKFKIPQDIKKRLLALGHSLSEIDGIRVNLKDGWWLLRASNTQDALVMRCEAQTSDGLMNVKNHLTNELKKSGIELSIR